MSLNNNQNSSIGKLRNALGVNPNGSIGDQRSFFAALERLRDSGDEECLFFCAFLEYVSPGKNAADEELMFHCVTGIRTVLLQTWTRVYSPEFLVICRDFFFHLTITTSSILDLPRSIFVACQGIAASLWKRGWLETSSPDYAQQQQPPQLHHTIHIALVNQMKNMLPALASTVIESPQQLMKHLEHAFAPSSTSTDIIFKTTSFVSILLGEFTSTNQTSRYNQPLDFHRRVHSTFETQGTLEDCLRLTITCFMNLHQDQQQSTIHIPTTLSLLNLLTDILSWDFGGHFFNTQSTAYSASLLIRAPPSWKQYLVNPNVLNTLFQLLMQSNSYHQNHNEYAKLRHAACQVLIFLASLHGPIFTASSPQNDEERLAFIQFLLDGCLHIFNQILQVNIKQEDGGFIIDMCHFVSRLIMSFKISTLVKMTPSSFENLLSAIATVGNKLLQDNLNEVRSYHGDVSSCIDLEWRQEALTHILDAIVALDDHWLRNPPGHVEAELAQTANHLMATRLAPLYKSYIECRIEMAKLEEHYTVQNCTDDDDDDDLVREEIAATQMQEEMSSASTLGRLNLQASLSTLQTFLQTQLLNKMKMLLESSATTMSADAAALLEETRLVLICISHLLADDSEGETPMIPERIEYTLQESHNIDNIDESTSVPNLIINTMQSVMTLAELQAMHLIQNPNNVHLSPLLASTMLNLLSNWAPAYIMPRFQIIDRNGADVYYWNQENNCQQVLHFCVTLALHYYAYWPQETQVTDAASSLLQSLAKRREHNLKKNLLQSQSFEKLVSLHIITASLRHSANTVETLESIKKHSYILRNMTDDATFEAMIKGYLRMPYSSRSKVVTAILMGSSIENDEKAKIMIHSSLEAIQNALSQTLQAVSNKQVSANNIHVQETICLIVELYGGVARASEISCVHLETIVQFMTSSLTHLSNLMTQYSQDLTICTNLLQLFCDYAEQFIAILNREQSLTLFQASAELLRAYSTQHCNSRLIITPSSKSYEEEKNYDDVSCAIQLLIHLGTKEFIDSCSNKDNSVDEAEVTDVIFSGLRHILPLMTQGLLQFPTLSTRFFSLVGFMMDTYPERVCLVPSDLFKTLFDSLLFGISHVDTSIAKSSLNGLAGLIRAHLKNNALSRHLAVDPELLENCCARLLSEVVFKLIVWDRLESTGMVLLPLAAVDINKFALVVQKIVSQQQSQQKLIPEQVARLEMAFTKLMKPEILSRVSSSGYEGRMNRIKFKKDFDEFVKEIHSFLVIR